MAHSNGPLEPAQPAGGTVAAEQSVQDSLHDAGDAGYHKSLSNRQVQMIAIGGAIGVGLFLGAGKRLSIAGPSLILSYAFCGIIAFFLMRALGELVMHRPSSGSFVSYSREFFGDRAAYMSGWMYMLNWMTSGIAEITAIATYISKWLPDVPHWITALIALVVVLAINLTSAKAFGELEFWAALLKVVALSAFLIVGTVLVIIGFKFHGQAAGLHNLTSPAGFFPNGDTLAFVMLMQGVVFAYATIELVGTAAGETDNAREVIPKAVKAVIYRIGLFYVGSVFLLSCLLPYTVYKAGESPFVTAFGELVPWIGDAMNVIVITAALSSCNSGLYSTGRILRSLAAAGEAPRFTSKLSKQGVPAGGILLTASVYFLGVILNAFLPGRAFDIAMDTAAVGIVWTWVTIFACQMALRKRINAGLTPATTFPMPGAPFTGWFGIISLIGIILIMFFDRSDPGDFLGMQVPYNWLVLGGAFLFALVTWLLWPLVKRNKERHPEFQRNQELSF